MSLVHSRSCFHKALDKVLGRNGAQRVSILVQISATSHPTFAKIHFADRRLSYAVKMDLIVWGSTVGIYAFTAVQYYNQVEMGRSRAGDVRAGSTGPRFWTTLSVYGQYYGMIVPQLLYWTTTAYNKFRQPEWLTEYALPKPPDVFGVDGVAVGRGVGLLLVFTGVHLMRKAIKVLGDQLNVIGVSYYSSVSPETGLRPSLVEDQGETQTR